MIENKQAQSRHFIEGDKATLRRVLGQKLK